MYHYARSVLRIVGCCLLACSSSQIGWAQIFAPLSNNSAFDSGLSEWFGENAVTTSSFAQSFQGYDTNGSVIYGGPMLQLPDVSHAYQIVTLRNISEYHLLNCVAYKQALAQPATPGWAGIGIVYYDAAWGVIDSFEKQIATGFTSGPAPFRPCSLGVRVPVGAAYAIIWAANDDPNSQAFFDDLKLYDYKQASYNVGLGPYLGSTSPIDFLDTTGQRLTLSGLQFWWMDGFVDYGTGLIGDVGRPSWIAQEVNVSAGQTVNVSLFNSNDNLSFTLPNFGVDYYDQNWNRIAGEYRTAIFYGDTNFESTAPAGTAHAVAWVWVDALTSIDQQVGIVGMSVLEPIPSER